MKITISKSQWEEIGRVAGWKKEALFLLNLDENKLDQGTEDSPSKPYSAKPAELSPDSLMAEYGEGDDKYAQHWMKVLSKKNDPENFDANAEKVQTYSQGTEWCTQRDHMAKRWLEQGDMYFLVVNSKNLVAVRTVDGKIKEARDTRNNSVIPKGVNRGADAGADSGIVKALVLLAKKEGLVFGPDF